MALEKLTENVAIHQTLGDNPNTDGEGMTASELKAAFDKGAEIIKEFINEQISPFAMDKRGDTLSGQLNAAGNKVTGLPDPTEDSEAAPKSYVDRNFGPAVESTENPGCYYRTVDGVTEWLNPPMELGVEYCTTERFNGKPVYTKLVNCGQWTPGAQFTLIDSGTIVRHAAYSGFYQLPYIYARTMDSAFTSIFRIEDKVAYMEGGAGITWDSVTYAQVWYTK